jgi:hypothetical protein
MTFDEATDLLRSLTRETLVDNAFGDTEVYWMRGEDEIASGYFAPGTAEVHVGETLFRGDDAAALRKLGKRGRVDRNDAGDEP